VNEFAAQHPILAVALRRSGAALRAADVAAYLTWFERKVVAHIQARWDPTAWAARAAAAAGGRLKFLFKEDPTPAALTNSPIFLRRFWRWPLRSHRLP